MLTLNPEAIDLSTLRDLWTGTPSHLDVVSLNRVRASAAAVERIVAGGETVYGINTGFGLLANEVFQPATFAPVGSRQSSTGSEGLGQFLAIRSRPPTLPAP